MYNFGVKHGFNMEEVRKATAVMEKTTEAIKKSNELKAEVEKAKAEVEKAKAEVEKVRLINNGFITPDFNKAVLKYGLSMEMANKVIALYNNAEIEVVKLIAESEKVKKNILHTQLEYFLTVCRK